MTTQYPDMNSVSGMESRLGIDIGRVLMKPGDDDADTSFLRGDLEDALRTPPNDGMFEAVSELVRLFGARVWLVSKCGPKIQEKTLRWLDRHRFFERTGIAPDHVRFCLRRPDKAQHCRELGITHFIDDRVDVLKALEGIVPHRYLFGEQSSKEMIPAALVRIHSWVEALALLTPSLGMESPPPKP